jgi:rubrerythrin
VSGHPHDEEWRLTTERVTDADCPCLKPSHARLETERDEALAREEAERAGRERAEAKLRAVAEREKFGQMTHWCRNENCGTISFGSGYKGKCPGCMQEGEAIALSAREPGKAS